jgi:hypothetical protein
MADTKDMGWRFRDEIAPDKVLNWNERGEFGASYHIAIFLLYHSWLE